MKPYEKLSLKEKIVVVCDFVDCGNVDYFDRLEKKANGYYYFCAEAEITTRYSAKNLVGEFEHYRLEELKEFYQERPDLYEGRF